MLHIGLDLSRRRMDYCLLGEGAERVEEGVAPADADGLRGLARLVALRCGDQPVRAVIESMNGARFVHDTLERCGWQVLIADAQKVKGLAPLACKTDRIDAWVLAELSRRDLVPAIWLPGFAQRQERERARWRLHLVKHRSALKQRVHYRPGRRAPGASWLLGSGGGRAGVWRRWAASAAPRSPESSSRGPSPKRSGTCSPTMKASLRQAPPSLWPHREREKESRWSGRGRLRSRVRLSARTARVSQHLRERPKGAKGVANRMRTAPELRAPWGTDAGGGTALPSLPWPRRAPIARGHRRAHRRARTHRLSTASA
jgi:hypothetical protein